MALLPNIFVLQRQLRQHQSLLLLLPLEVINGLPAARNLVLDVIAEAETGVAGARHNGRTGAPQARTPSIFRRFSVPAGLS